MKKYKRSLFIFRRDLRLFDNTALLNAGEQSEEVIPCFIIDPRQVGAANKYRSSHAMQFMAESLKELDATLKEHQAKLYVFEGEAHQVVEKICNEISVDALFMNADYTPFSTERDQVLERLCQKRDIHVRSYDDCLLNPPNAILTIEGKPYAVFSAYYKKALLVVPDQPRAARSFHFYTKNITFSTPLQQALQRLVPHRNDHLYVHGGREEGLALLDDLDRLKNYAKTRDFPSLETSKLSAHHKFGTLSIREVYAAIVEKLGDHHPLIRQLYWRDFFTMVAYHAPHVYGKPFYAKYASLLWSTKEETLGAWQEGKTGFPLVDAGMRQLLKTGYMHNRVRMITASFLVKDLHHHWLEGERYFAQHLVDYDPAVNNGNWQWVASTGCDASPYFRIFNPWLQQKKFDPDCAYIKQWVPELRSLPPQKIHRWYAEKESGIDYPRPIIDHAIEASVTKDRYKKAAKSASEDE